MDPLLLPCLMLLVALTVALVYTHQRRRAGQQRLAEAVGHPSSTTRTSRAVQVAQELGALGMIADRRRFVVTTPGMDGFYILHVLDDTVAVGLDCNRGRLFVGIAYSPTEAAMLVAQHAGHPTSA